MSRYVLSIIYGINLAFVFNCYYIYLLQYYNFYIVFTVNVILDYNVIKKLVLSQVKYRHWITNVFLFSFSLTNCSLSPLLNFVNLFVIYFLL